MQSYFLFCFVLFFKWSCFNCGLWRHFCHPSKKSLGLLGSLSFHSISCSCCLCPVPQSSWVTCSPWNLSNILLPCLSLSWVWCQLYFLPIPVIMGRIPFNSPGSTQMPPPLQNFLSFFHLDVTPQSIQRTLLVPLLGHVLCLIHITVFWVCVWFF